MPLFIGDRWSSLAEDRLASSVEPLLLSDFAVTEFAAVVAQQTRMRRIDSGEADGILEAFDSWRQRATLPVAMSPADLTRAAAWLRSLSVHLHAPDVMPIAAAARLDAALVTFDVGMAAAARALSMPLEAAPLPAA